MTPWHMICIDEYAAGSTEETKATFRFSIGSCYRVILFTSVPLREVGKDSANLPGKMSLRYLLINAHVLFEVLYHTQNIEFAMLNIIC